MLIWAADERVDVERPAGGGREFNSGLARVVAGASPLVARTSVFRSPQGQMGTRAR